MTEAENDLAPLTIPRGTFREALHSLGISTDGLLRLESDPRKITLTYKRRDDLGQGAGVRGGGIATITVTVPLDYDDPAR
jgi:hypothetical protein